MLKSQNSQHMVFAVPLETNEGVVVHVVDDDASLRDALKGLFETVGLTSRTYGTARDFSTRDTLIRLDASLSMSVCPT